MFPAVQVHPLDLSVEQHNPINVTNSVQTVFFVPFVQAVEMNILTKYMSAMFNNSAFQLNG